MFVGPDRKRQIETRALTSHTQQHITNQPELEVMQSRVEKALAIGCLLMLIVVVVAVVIWPGLVIH